MTPRTELNDLLSRTRNLLCAIALMVLSLALLVVSMGVLFFSVFTTVFRVSLGVVDRMTMKVAVPGIEEAEESVHLIFPQDGRSPRGAHPIPSPFGNLAAAVRRARDKA